MNEQEKARREAHGLLIKAALDYANKWGTLRGLAQASLDYAGAVEAVRQDRQDRKETT